MRDNLKNTILVCFSIATSFVLCELLARGLGMGVDFLGVTLEQDARYGHRVASEVVVDSWGFRNHGTPGKAEIVCIGDSQTYGVNASSGNSWPSQLSRTINRTTYNLAVGGYGPIQYERMWDDYVAELDPSIVIFAVYLGNDIRDAFVYTGLLPEDDPLRPDSVPSLPRVGNGTGNGMLGGVREFLYRNSVSYNMMKLLFPRTADRLKRIDHKGVDEIETDGRVMSFDVTVRLEAIQQKNSENVIGLNITLEIIRKIARKCRESGRRCVLAVIPTKESVYERVVREAGASNGPFEMLWAAEKSVRESILDAAAEARMETVDLLPSLAEAADSSDIYPGFDGHPNANGYRIIAQSIGQKIMERR